MYELKNFRDERLKTESIILCQARNLYKVGSYLEPAVMQENYHYTWQLWQQYFNIELQKFRNPCHYFCELLDKDYVIYTGLGMRSRSWFLEDLAKAGAIPYRYMESILILMQVDMSKEIPDDRMLEHLASKIIMPLKRQYKFDFKNIIYLDDILVEGYDQKIKDADLKYDIRPATFFNILDVEFICKKYLT